MTTGASYVTRKGQVTIPAAIRSALAIKEGDRIEFVLEGDEVRLKPVESVVARTAGIFRTEGPALSAEELRAAAEEAFADEALERAR